MLYHSCETARGELFHFPIWLILIRNMRFIKKKLFCSDIVINYFSCNKTLLLNLDIFADYQFFCTLICLTFIISVEVLILFAHSWYHICRQILYFFFFPSYDYFKCPNHRATYCNLFWRMALLMLPFFNQPLPQTYTRGRNESLFNGSYR